MALPKMLLGDAKAVLLSGFQEANSKSPVFPVQAVVDSEESPTQAERNPDADVFSYVTGEWWPE